MATPTDTPLPPLSPPLLGKQGYAANAPESVGGADLAPVAARMRIWEFPAPSLAKLSMEA